MKDRIKAIRKKKKLTQSEFAAQLGFGKSTAVKWESGVTEPNKAAQKLICSTFGVNEEWLLHGTGEMLTPDAADESEFIEKLCETYKNGSVEFRAMMKCYMRLTDENRAIIDEYVQNLVSELNTSDDPITVEVLSGDNSEVE